VEKTMLSGSEKYYDDIYGAMGKDYAAEANTLHKLIQIHKHTEGNALLDVACGTGTHAGLLRKYYKVEGIDLNADMLKTARKKHPDIRFSIGDMRNFDLSRQFDVVSFQCHRLYEDKNRASKSNQNHEPSSLTRRRPAGGTLVYIRTMECRTSLS
jgi:ubiquinone/menaquinone biosynthesis C-methylase UbiE